jgi:WD40 repeat protein/tRNA A-37 threonylcarbamoyl transferase component Bud32
MNDETRIVLDDAGCLDDVMLAYLQSVESGQPLDRDDLIAAHPHLAAELADFFGNQDRIARLADELPTPLGGRRRVPRRIRVFGDYESLEEIAQGGMGVVFKARQKSLNRTVAVKMVLAGSQASDSAVRRFRAEAEAVAQLQHPAIVSIYEVGEHEGQPYFSMEYVAGASLAELARRNPLPAREAAEYIRQAAVAVQFAHEHGVLHRDLKPSNLLLDASGQVRITDFGLAKHLADDDRLTTTGEVLGTPSYMAPEQARGDRPHVGPQADVYALGAVLYELLTGRPPFHAATAVETLRQVQDADPVSLRQLNASVPRDLETIALRCLQKRPADRYGSAAELVADLGRYLRGEPILARPIGAVARFWRWCRRKPVVASLSATVMVLAVAMTLVSTVAAVWLRDERNTIRNQNETIRQEVNRALAAESAEREVKESYREALWQSYAADALAARANRRVGHRFAALEALRQAAEIRQADSIRDEAITCLTLSDLKRVGDWPAESPFGSESAMDSDGALAHIAVMEGEGEVVVRRILDGGQVARLPALSRHVDFVRFAPGGQRVAILYRGGRIVVRTIAEGKILLDVRGKYHRDGLDFSPDGAHLAAAGDSVDLFDLESGTPVVHLACPGPAWHARFHPRYPRTKQLAVCMGPSQEVALWMLGNEAPAKYIQFPARIHDIGWDHEGRRLVAAGDDSDVHIYDTVNGEHSSLAEGHRFIVSGVAMNPRLPIAATYGQDGQTFLWDLDGQHALLNLEGIAVRWSDDGRRLALRNGPHAGIWEWDPARASRQFHFTKRSRNTVHRTAFHPRLPLVASAGPDGVRLWETPTGRFLGKVGTEYTYDVAFNPRDGAIFVNDLKGLATWPITSESAPGPVGRLRVGPARRLKLPRGADDLRGIAIDAAGNTLVTTWPIRPEALVVDLRSGAVKQLPTLPRVRYLAIDHAGRYAAFGTNKERDVDVWDVQSPRRVKTLSSPGSAWPQFSDDGSWLVVSSPTGYRVWEVGTWREVMAISREHDDELGLVAFLPGGTVAALTKSRSVVQLVDLASRRVLANLDAAQPAPRLFDLDVSRDGSLLAVAQGNRGVRLWDLALMRRQLTEMGHRFDVPMGGRTTGERSGPLVVVVDPG